MSLENLPNKDAELKRIFESYEAKGCTIIGAFNGEIEDKSDEAYPVILRDTEHDEPINGVLLSTDTVLKSNKVSPEHGDLFYWVFYEDIEDNRQNDVIFKENKPTSLEEQSDSNAVVIEFLKVLDDDPDDLPPAA